MKWTLALLIVHATAQGNPPQPVYDWNGREYTLDAMPEPLRTKLLAPPDAGILNGLAAAAIYGFPKECQPPDSKNCVIRYDLEPKSQVPICKDERGQVGRLVDCLEKTAAGYQRMTNLSVAKTRGAVENFNKLVPGPQHIDWDKVVAPELSMARAGWATRERLYAASLASRMATGCATVDDPEKKLKCEHLARDALIAIHEHTSKGLIYEQAVKSQDQLWQTHDLPADLKIVLDAKGSAAPRPGGTKPPPGGLTLKRPASDKKKVPSDFGMLQACAQFNPPIKQGSGEGPCTPLTTESLAFQKDVERVMGYASILTYFDILRVEAMSVSLKSYRDLFGPMPKLPEECAAFSGNLGTANGSPVSTETRDFYHSTDYYQMLKRAAALVDTLSREAASLSEVPQFIPSTDLNVGEGPNMTLNPDYLAARKRLPEIEEELLDVFGKFPTLKGFHESGKLLYEANRLGPLLGADPDNPAAMKVVLLDARRKIAGELTENLSRFCDEKATPWNELIRENGLVKSVLDKYPQFRPFHLCALDIAEKEALPGEMLVAAVGLACTIAIAGPQAVVGGPVCGVAGLLMAGNEFLTEEERLATTEKCRAAGDAICSGEDYLEARRSYEASVDGLITMGVLSVADVAVTVSAFKNLARTLKARELAELTGKLKRATSLEAETLGRRLREIAELPEGRRAAALSQVLDDALAGGRTDLIKELAKGAEASESEIANFFSKHYGLASDDPEVKILARAAKARFGSEAGHLTAQAETEFLDRLLAACHK